MAEDQTAQEACTLITNLFLDNQMTCLVYLEVEFLGLNQGDLSITAYCHCLKALSDALSDVGTPVSDQTLILNYLCGLNPCFSDITTIATMQSPLPSFTQTRSLLTLRETQLTISMTAGNQTALYSDGPSNGAGSSNSSDQHRGGSNRGEGTRRGGNSGGNSNNGRNGRTWHKKKGNDDYNQAATLVVLALATLYLLLAHGFALIHTQPTTSGISSDEAEHRGWLARSTASDATTCPSLHLSSSSAWTCVRHQPTTDSQLRRHFLGSRPRWCSILGLDCTDGRPQQCRHPLNRR